jgi:hypothetical protein
MPGPNSTTQDELKTAGHVDLPTHQSGAVSIQHRRHAYLSRAGSELGPHTWSVRPWWSFWGSVCDSTAEGDSTQQLRSVLEHRSPKRKTDGVSRSSPGLPRRQHTGQNNLNVEVPGSIAFTSVLNLSLSDSRPDKLTLISLAGSGFVCGCHKSNRPRGQDEHLRRATS